MDLITDLGTRSTISKSGKTDTRKWGLFKCPTCSSSIELKMYKGTHNKTCGKAGCRIVDRSSCRISEDTKLKNSPHYSSFTDFHKRIRDNSCGRWYKLSNFRDDMYTTYTEAKKKYNRVTLFINDNTAFSKDNCKWVSTDYSEVYDFSKDEGKYHTLMLVAELDTTKANVLRSMKKLQNFGDTTYDKLGCPGYLSRPYKAHFLTKAQYIRLKDVLVATAKKKSDNIYIMRCNEFYKIGVSANVQSRLSSLNGSTPFGVNLCYSRKINDALLVERALHKKYKDFNVNKEWFNLTTAQVKEITTYLDNKVK